MDSICRPRMSFLFWRARWEFMIGMEGGLSAGQAGSNELSDRADTHHSIIEDRNGTVSFVRSRGSAEAGGLCQIIGTGMRCYGKADGLPGSNVATALVEDGLGNLWTGSDTAWSAGNQTHPLRTAQGTEIVPRIGRRTRPGCQPRWLSLGWNDFRWRVGIQQLVQGAWKPFATPEFDAVPWKFKRFS